MDHPVAESVAPAETTFIPKTHVSLNVSDIERSVAFYEAFFGEAAHKRRPGYANFDVTFPPLKLALNEHMPTATGTQRLSHLGIQVGTAEEVDATRARLETSGVVMFNEGDTVCCYARQDKVWVTDPDGNSWEVYVLLDEMDDHDDHEFETHGKVGETACCSDVSTPQLVALTLGKAKTGGNVSGSGCC